MEPNGLQGQPAPIATQPQGTPTPQPQAPVNQPQHQPTPQFNILPAGPTGQPVQPQAPTPQPQPQPAAQVSEINSLRQQIATGLGVQLDQVPSDVASLSKIVSAGYYAAQQLQQRQGQPQPAPQPQAPAQPQQQDRLTPKEMAPGWERMVERAQDGTYRPVHPNFASVAADANYNEGVYAARSVAVNQGQFLPEQQKSVEEIISRKLEQERESMRASLFMEANESKLFVMNNDGSRKMEVQPDGTTAPARTELGLEMYNVAQEILQSGAQFASQHDLAKYALKVAEGRLKMKQQQSQQQEQQVNTQPAHNDLAALLSSHKQSGNAGGGNINTMPAPMTNDFRANMRALLKGAPANGNGMDMLNFIKGR